MSEGVSDVTPIEEQPTMVAGFPAVSPDPVPVMPVADAPTTPALSTYAPPAASPDLLARTTEVLTCPECGNVQSVSLNHRDATDFCNNCDYPLFWTPARVQRDRDAAASDLSLRRLPGTVGRATIASKPCPHCSEPNAFSAQVCVRCGLSLNPVAPPPPPPAPVYLPPPAPVYEEPEKQIPWWVWVLVGFTVVLLVGFGILWATGTIG
jgi:hypothetical protein